MSKASRNILSEAIRGLEDIRMAIENAATQERNQAKSAAADTIDNAVVSIEEAISLLEDVQGMGMDAETKDIYAVNTRHEVFIHDGRGGGHWVGATSCGDDDSGGLSRAEIQRGRSVTFALDEANNNGVKIEIISGTVQLSERVRQ